MLTVVEQDQGGFRPEVIDQGLCGTAARLFAHVDRSHQGLRNQVGVGYGGELREPDVCVLLEHLAGQLDGESGLADAAGSYQSYQPAAGQERPELFQFRASTEEGGELQREVVLADVQRFESWKLGEQPFDIELIQVLGPREVF